MKEKINPSNLKDYTEPTWFLGTDICEEADLFLLDQGIGTAFAREEGAILHVGVLKEIPNFYELLGFSPYFQDVLREANARGYVWVFLDRDISSF